MTGGIDLSVIKIAISLLDKLQNILPRGTKNFFKEILNMRYKI
jgi:hypothetical protein